MQAFSDALRREMHPWGINVSIIEPGGFKTQMSDARVMERQLRQGWNNLSDELKREYGEKIFTKRLEILSFHDGSPVALENFQLNK